MTWQIDKGEIVPLSCLYYDDKGDPISGADVRIDVIDPLNDSYLLQGQAAAESVNVPGLYYYHWQSPDTIKKHITVYMYEFVGNKYFFLGSDCITINDIRDFMEDTIDDNDVQGL